MSRKSKINGLMT